MTIPDRVYGVLTDSTLLIPDQDAELLFSNMAELASLENGVLGYLNYYDTHPLDDLLEPGYGSWADKMNPVFNEKDKGYVLLVGETEIVPSFYIGESHFITYPGIPTTCTSRTSSTRTRPARQLDQSWWWGVSWAMIWTRSTAT